MNISLQPLRFRRALTFFVMAALTISAAPAPVTSTWAELPMHLKGKNVTAILLDGKSTRGRFVAARPDLLVLSNGHEIARKSISLIRVEVGAQTNLRDLHDTVHPAYAHAFGHLFSPSALLGLIEIPALTAYSAVTLPFCAAGDLFQRSERSTWDLHIKPDAK